jgi:hypothetical protein
MTDTTGQKEVEAPRTWPGYPKIPPCVAGKVDPWDDDSVIAAVIDAVWQAAPQHPILKECKCDESVKDFCYYYELLEALADIPRFRLPSRFRELFEIANTNCRWWGYNEWDWDTFERDWKQILAWRRADPKLRAKMEAAEEELYEKEQIREALGLTGKPAAAGRKATKRTTDADIVRGVLDVAHARAYKILSFGTSKLEDRVALAEAFADDPIRCKPEAWELKTGSSWGGARRTFGEYVFKGVDAEGENPVVVAARGLLQRGLMPTHLTTLEQLTTALQHEHGLDLNQAVALWWSYQEWRRG